VPSLTDRGWARLLGGYAAFTGIVILVTVPVAIAVDPLRRPALMRVAAAIVLAVMLIDLVRAARALVQAQPPSPFEAALRPVKAATVIDRRFQALRDEVRFGITSANYWDRVLWPRLCELANRLPGRPRLTPPDRVPRRGLLRRGPRLSALRAIIGKLEEGS
jgi:hypothetical protein